MPIYEYICQSCGNDFEKLTSFSNTSVPECPSCHGTSVERQLSTPAIHFKGSGWYINDSKPSSKESANGAKNGSTNGKEGDPSAKSSDNGAESKTDPAKSDSAKNESSKGETAKSSADTASSSKGEKQAATA